MYQICSPLMILAIKSGKASMFNVALANTKASLIKSNSMAGGLNSYSQCVHVEDRARGEAPVGDEPLGDHAAHRQHEEQAEHQHRPSGQQQEAGDALHRDTTSVQSVSHCSRCAATSAGAGRA